jgi:hypothetical protein
LPVDALNLPGGRQGEMAVGDVAFFVEFCPLETLWWVRWRGYAASMKMEKTNNLKLICFEYAE